MNRIIYSFVLIIISSIFDLQAAYYDTLPMGRFNLQYRKIKTNSIVNSFDSSGVMVSNNINFNLDANSIYGANEVLDNYFDELKSINPEAFHHFQIGQYEINPSANIEVDVYGFGFGLTNKTTVYFGIPFYRAVVNVEFKRTAGNNYHEIKEMLSENDSGIVGQITNGLPDITEGVIQTVLIDHYGTSPIGTWSGEGVGDIEAGIMHQIYKGKNFGALTKFGTIFPTGKMENPDILQDISFGDGQVDAFVEAGIGGAFFGSSLEYTFNSRYTYQFSSQKTRRIPDMEGISLGVNKTQITEKLGNKFDTFSALKYEVFDVISFQAAHIFNYQGATEITSDNANLFPSFESSYSQNIELRLAFNTVKKYMDNQKFFMPLEISASVLKTLSGKNIQDITRSTLQLSLYF